MDRSGLRAAVVGALADAEALQRKLTDLLASIDGTGELVAVPRQGEWTKEQVELLWTQAKHLDGVRALFELTASTPGETITYAQLLARSGLDEGQQRTEHARLSRISTQLFGEKRWPIENWQGTLNQKTGKEEMVYRMDPTIAKWWTELQG
ncbi:hypothetical protein DN069_07770 [Streptacidiphilus pinicola]|uniref:Uncharacterized protein n=1 Tax=Streptacidiphilus pinicola TaxID=2219663 RepID=A0A2X0ISE1_9ACTN|nr:hypothetical protein [Streptacidiphilus pinicola]RAG86171.1 hypothetical protein DN069_07770 [Streptacidiphilus pinicola]